MNVVVVIDVYMMFKFNVVVNGVQLTQWEYVCYFALKVFDKMPK